VPVHPPLVLVPDPKPTPVLIAFSIACVILEAIYASDEIWDEINSPHILIALPHLKHCTTADTPLRARVIHTIQML